MLSRAAGGAHQQAQFSASGQQLPGNVTAQKSGRACDKAFHLAH